MFFFHKGARGWAHPGKATAVKRSWQVGDQERRVKAVGGFYAFFDELEHRGQLRDQLAATIEDDFKIAPFRDALRLKATATPV